MSNGVTVGFVGLGAMGAPMARNLLAAGFEVTVFNRSRAPAQELEADGARIARTVEDAAAQDFAVTMLADDSATTALVLDSGFIAAMPRHGVHIGMATISAELGQRLANAHAAAGRAYVSAPVFGRPPAAAARQLFIVAAGASEALAGCAGIFETLGQRTFTAGDDPVRANVIKIAGNFMLASMIESLGEAFALTSRYGVEPAHLLDILTNSVFPVPAYKIYGGIIAGGAFEPPGFPLRLGLKDIRLALAAADGKEVALPLASLIRDHYLKALTRGYQDLDWAALALVSMEDAGAAARR
jgi:3-hydroxyisobutyrate dehydrogenase-like beta-hydroxyacid dehydrogenase